jgi:hypothetical protein
VLQLLHLPLFDHPNTYKRKLSVLFASQEFAVVMSLNTWAIKLKYQHSFIEMLWVYIGLGFVLILPNLVYGARST